MITVQLKGGLGNQLYQIAAIYAHAKEHNVKFVINYSLEFGAMQGQHPRTYKKSLYKNLETIDLPFHIACREPSFKYKKLPFLGIEHDVVYDGYFQSWKYFKNLDRDQLNNVFPFSVDCITKTKKAIRKLKEKYQATEVVGVHIRRGDYYKNPEIFPIVGSEYYNKAKENFDKDALFLYCTDDETQVRKEFKFDTKNVLANGSDELMDMCVLSECDSVIMGNSSFSSWGAYLGKEKKLVTSPKKWFGPKGPPDGDLVDPKWLKI